MSTRAPSFPEDDDFTADEARAFEAFLAALFGPAPRKKPRAKRSVRSALSVQSVRSAPLPQSPTPSVPHSLSPSVPHSLRPSPVAAAYTFTSPEPRFKSCGVFSVHATSHREACAQVLLHADAIADAMRTILSRPAHEPQP